MTSATLKPATPWQALLWKDFNQVKTASMTIVVALLATQLGTWIIAAINAPRSFLIQHATESTVIYAFAAPILVAVGCCGMLLGHERETSTWTWNSSLPIAWHASLLSKSMITFLFAALSLCMLCLIPALGATAIGGLNPSSQQFTIMGAILTVVLTIDVFIFFSIAILLVRDTLHAMVIAAAWVILIQPTLIAIVGNFGAPWRGATTEQFVAAGILILIGGLLLAGLYRWRWQHGNHSVFAVRFKPLESVSNTLMAGLPREPLSESSALFRLAWLNNAGARALICAVILLLVYTSVRSPDAGAFAVPIAGFFLLGTSAFAGDQPHSRYRFLADRGATPAVVTISRLVPPLVMALTLGGISMAILYRPHIGVFALLLATVIGLIYFLLGALGSLCFRQPVTAVTVNALAAIASVTISSLVLNSSQLLGFVISETELLPALFFFHLIVTLPLLTFAIFRTTNRWLLTDESNLGWHYVAVVTIALLVPAALTLSVAAAKSYELF